MERANNSRRLDGAYCELGMLEGYSFWKARNRKRKSLAGALGFQLFRAQLNSIAADTWIE